VHKECMNIDTSGRIPSSSGVALVITKAMATAQDVEKCQQEQKPVQDMDSTSPKRSSDGSPNADQVKNGGSVGFGQGDRGSSIQETASQQLRPER
jgi:hypothetical protein